MDGGLFPLGRLVSLALAFGAAIHLNGRHLVERGVPVDAGRPPRAPLGKSRRRIAVSVAHGPEQIDSLLQALTNVLPRVA